MSWQEVSLKEICDADWGNTKLTKSSYVNEGKFLAVSAAGADGLIDHYEHEANVPVLSAIGAQCGRMFYPGARFTAIKNTITLTPKKDISDGKFLYYLFTHVELPQRGAGQPFISKGDIEAFRVNIPMSIEKQREIVEKLDRAFTEIDLLEENLQLNADKSNQLLQSLLSAAFTSSDSDLEPLSSSTEKETLIDGCLGDLGKWITGSTPSTAKKEYWGDEFLFVTPSDLGSNGELGQVGRRISKLGAQKVRIVNPPSVPLVCIGASLGKVAWTSEAITTNQQISTLQPNGEKADPKFAMYLLSSPNLQRMLWGASTGTTVPIINKGNLEKVRISIPSLEKQREIVQKLNSAYAEIDLFRNQIAMEKSYAIALRQSLLNSAFTQEEEVA